MGSVAGILIVKAVSIHCPNCGGPVELRGFAHTLTAVCPQCLTVLDAADGKIAILQRQQAKLRRTPTLPLGRRAKFNGILSEVIGFQARQLMVDGTAYEWWEYVLFNPYQGFRYLVEYNGHFSLVTAVKAVPSPRGGSRPSVVLEGRNYVHFSHYEATTVFVLGEFPWRVQVGETADTNDFTSPPYMLSAESTPGEVTWSRGEYLTGKAVWDAFAAAKSPLPGQPPVAHGIYLNQPSPHAGKAASAWSLFAVLLALLIVMMVYFASTATNREVFRQSYTFTPGTTAEPSFVTPIFEVAGRPDNVEVTITTNVSNSWAFFGLAIINNDTEQGYDFGREVSYYYGSDSDGSWSEGSSKDDVTVPHVVPGKYYLRVEPDADPTIGALHYEITVRRGVPAIGIGWLIGFLLLVPPLIVWYRSYRFEQQRWSESDYAGGGSAGSSSGSDDD